MSISSSQIKIMIAAVTIAAKKINRDFYEIRRLQNSRNKDGLHKFVELAYTNSRNVMERELRKSMPDSSFDKEDNAGFYWKINPLDGANNFCHGIPFFAISICLVRGADVDATVVMLPHSGEIFWAERGEGSYFDHHNNINKLRINAYSTFQPNLVALNGVNGDIARAVRGIQYRVIGSNLVANSYLIAGRFDAVIYVVKDSDDLLLIEEAGGALVRVKDYLVAGSNELVKVLVERLKDE